MIWVLAGTTEGRELIGVLRSSGYGVIGSAATKYGASLIADAGAVEVLGPIDAEGMKELLRTKAVEAVVDATHPFSVEASRNAMAACASMSIPYLRLERNGARLPADDSVHIVRDFEEAGKKASELGDVIFYAAGSRNLERFLAGVNGKRVVARILPDRAALDKCLKLGLSPGDIIAAQGPFSREANAALLVQCSAGVLVTKESGTIGGTEAKIDAARSLGIPVVVIARPRLDYPMVARDSSEVMRWLKSKSVERVVSSVAASESQQNQRALGLQVLSSRGVGRVHGGDVWKYFPIVDFSSNVNPLGPPRGTMKVLSRAAWKMRYYPDTDARELKAELAARIGVGEGNIVFGNGSTELIKCFCEAFLGAGDEVLIVEPTFSEYGLWSERMGARIRRVVSSSEEGFEVPTSSVEELKGAKAFFLCNPNNPTGKLAADVEAMIEEASREGVLFFLDEAYMDFTRAENACRLVDENPNLIVLRSLTKFYSIPGLRAGYAVASDEITEVMKEQLVPWNVNVLAQAVALHAIRDEEFPERSRAYLEREKTRLFEGLSKLGVKTNWPDANFFLLDVREFGITGAELRQALIERGILIRDCASFHGLDEYYVRISVRKRKENDRLLAELGEVLRDVRRR